MKNKMLKFRNLIFILFITTIGSSLTGAEISGSTIESNIFEQDDKFLNVDDAFIISTDLLDNEFIIRWKIADGYYLYNHRFSFSAPGAEFAEP